MSVGRCASRLARVPFRARALPAFNAPLARASAWQQCQIVRPFSISAPRASKSFDFDALQPYTQSLPNNTVLIDVREPAEYAEGHIPNAINIPVQSKPDALLLPEEEFEDHFGFAKPSTDAETIFYCKAGVRSRAASQIAKQAGYNKVGDYAGSWLDWTAKGGKVAR